MPDVIWAQKDIGHDKSGLWFEYYEGAPKLLSSKPLYIRAEALAEVRDALRIIAGEIPYSLHVANSVIAEKALSKFNAVMGEK